MAATLWAGPVTAAVAGPHLVVAAAADEEPEATYQPPWDDKQVLADLTTQDIVVVPGAIARFDQEVIGDQLAAAGFKLLVLPPGPIDSEENKAYRSFVSDLQRTHNRAAKEEAGPDGARQSLLMVVGLEVSVTNVGIGPTSLLEYRRLLEAMDPTDLLEFGIQYELDETKLDQVFPPLEPQIDPAEVAGIVAALQQQPLFFDGDDRRPTAQLIDRFERQTGRTLRLVVLPPGELGAAPTVTAAALAESFPDDVVVLFRGRWFEAAGPDQSVWDAARNITLSTTKDFLLTRDVAPSNMVKLLGDSYEDLTSGAVTDQAAPTQINPLAWLLVILPVLAIGAIVFFGLRHNKPQAAAAQQRHDRSAESAGVAAALPALAAGILALDGLAQEGKAKNLLDRAVELYRAARDAVVDDAAEAARAVAAARQSLTSAAAELGISGVPGTIGDQS